MLVKIDDGAALNMLGIDSVIVTPVERSQRIGIGLFSKGTEEKWTEYNVVIAYRDADGEKDRFTLKCGKNLSSALKVKDNVLAQVKELENVGATQALEEVLRNG